MYTENNSFHLVDSSPWPIVTSSALLMLTSSVIMYMHGVNGGNWWMIISIIYVIASVSYWLRDVIRESSYQGDHTSIVQNGVRIGVIMFIVTEVMFFFGFFVAYFWSSFGANVEIGSVWVPNGIVAMNAYEIPLLNTLILLSSGASITWAHHSIVSGNRNSAIEGLVVTIVLAIIFTGFQVYEYMHATFTISDSIYGSTFYMLTGFHGFHVIVGTIMLIVSMVSLINYEQTNQHHFGFESSAWYWHFVDVVWLFLFVAVYCWSN